MPRLFGFADLAYQQVREQEAEGIRTAVAMRVKGGKLACDHGRDQCGWLSDDARQ